MKNNLWFRRKTYGWGWTPITWQGWLVTAFFLAMPLVVKLIVRWFEFSKNIQTFSMLSVIPLVVVGLVVVCLRHGEKPRWQWGIKTTKLSHIDLNVSDYKKSVLFYDLILLTMGWEKLSSQKTHTAYSDGTLKIILSPVEEKYLQEGFHRKRVGLNHLAIYAQTKEVVDLFYKEVLVANGIPTLYEDKPMGDKKYYSVFFEDPDRLKLEVVYAPFYCDRNQWPNNLPNDFDPYLS